MSARMIALIGLNHHSAPVEIRERLALTGDGLRLALKAIRDEVASTFHEAVILSTCNRFEVYAAAASPETAQQGFDDFVQQFYGMDPAELAGYLYHKAEADAIIHLMRVAAGLE